jgi:hypothetical protein
MANAPGRRAVALACLLLLPVSFARAQSPAPAAPASTNDDCLLCHAEPSTTRATGQPVVVDAAAFTASIHGQLEMACVDCHADLAAAELPHAETLARVDCGTCHDGAAQAHARSVHGRTSAVGGEPAARCVSCHGVHDILGSKDPASRTYHLTLGRTCGECHGARAAAPGGPPGGDVAGVFEDSIHGRALSRAGLIVAPSCASCHGAHDIAGHLDPASTVARLNVPRTCGTCHDGIERAYARGKHGHELQGRNPKAPACIDCHSAHAIARTDIGSWRVDVIRECGTCHEESIATYRDTFHGQVTALGFARVATCADCHGAHDVRPKADPASPIHDANRVAMCRKCHARANDNFAQYDPHANRHDPDRSRVLYYAGRFMDLLLIGVFGFFSIHTTLWFRRSWRLVRERRAAGEPSIRGEEGDGDDRTGA